MGGRRRARVVAVLIGGAFVVLSLVYIVASGELAAPAAGRYVAFVGLGLTLFAWFLLDRIARRDEDLLRLERLATAGQLSAAIAHDANNLLLIARIQAHLLESRLAADPDGLDRVSSIQATVERLVELSRRLIAAGGNPLAEAPVPTDLVELVAQEVRLLKQHDAAGGRTLRQRATDEDAAGCVFPDLVRQIVFNLVLNALQATEPGGVVEIGIERRSDGVALVVEDDGPGFTADKPRQLLEPFVTRRKGGTGLGLFSVRAATRAHGGTVSLARSETLGGARVEILLPDAAALLPLTT